MHNISVKEFHRDRALQWHMHADYDRMVEAGVPLPIGRTKRDRQAIASIASGIISSARTAPGQWMSYSRSESWYPGQEMYYGDAYGYSTVVGAIERLADGPLIESHIKAKPGDHLKRDRNGLTQQSRILPAVAAVNITLPSVGKELAQSIRLRRRDDKRLVPYRDTESVARMRSMLTKLNAHYADADIEFRGGRREGDIVFHISKRGHEYGVDISSRACHRVFSDTFTQGGRYYGAAWQALGEDARSQILINGEEVVEIDFATLHPKILYDAAGLRLEGDAYDIVGFRDQREECKKALNILINAAGYGEAVYALSEHLRGGYDEAVDLIEAIRWKHQAISHHFHSDAGVRLQKIDSDICTSILNDLTLKQGITCLSVHDSFIVQSSCTDVLAASMEHNYRKHITKGRGILNSLVKTTGIRSSPPHKGTILHSDHGGSCCTFATGSESESETPRNPRNIRERNRRTAPACLRGSTTSLDTTIKAERSKKPNGRFDRVKRKHLAAPTIGSETRGTFDLKSELESRRNRAVESILEAQVGTDKGHAAERAVGLVPGGSVVASSPSVHLLVGGIVEAEAAVKKPKSSWQPRKMTMLEIIKAEEARRDIANHRRRERSY